MLRSWCCTSYLSESDSSGCTLSNGTVVPVGGRMPIDPKKPCSLCDCGGNNQTTNCGTLFCQRPNCHLTVHPPGECCKKCGAKCTIPTNFLGQISQDDKQSRMVDYPMYYKSVNAKEFIYCTCSKPGGVATCQVY
ncbi:hypothetical protein ACOMHN_025318 [Nucella lapillus]